MNNKKILKKIGFSIFVILYLLNFYQVLFVEPLNLTKEIHLLYIICFIIIGLANFKRKKYGLALIFISTVIPLITSLVQIM